jgi:MFS family permease
MKSLRGTPANDAVRRGDRVAFYAARFISQAGQSLFLAALVIAAGTHGSAPLALSSVLAASLAASVLFGLPGGALADRLGPGVALAVGAFLRFAAIAAGLSVAGHPSALWIVSFAYSAASQFFSPAEVALVATVQAREPARAHTLLVVLQYAGQGLGALLAPALLVLGGPRLMFGGAALIYVLVVAVATVLALRLGQRGAVRSVPARRAFSFAEPFRFIAREPRAIYAVGLLVFTDIALKGAVVAVPRYLSGDLGFGRLALVGLGAAGVIGAGAGLLWTGRVRTFAGAAGTVRFAFIGTVAAIFALITLSQGLGEASELSRIGLLTRLGAASGTSFAAVLPVAFLLGLCITAGPIGARSLLTELAPAGQQARVFAVQATLTHAIVILPLLLAGVGAQFVGPRASLALIGTMGMAAVLALEAARLRRRVPSPALAVVREHGG